MNTEKKNTHTHTIGVHTVHIMANTKRCGNNPFTTSTRKIHLVFVSVIFVAGFVTVLMGGLSPFQIVVHTGAGPAGPPTSNFVESSVEHLIGWMTRNATSSATKQEAKPAESKPPCDADFYKVSISR
jgi:hypothetical protein